MAKCMSAADLKGTTTCPKQDFPKNGTKIRALYDNFVQNKGCVIDFHCNSQNTYQLDTLRNTYGLDIRRMGKKKYCLVGEWFGKVYVDYVAMRTNADMLTNSNADKPTSEESKPCHKSP